MTEQEFLEHHGLRRNPFADEDAQTDAVFQARCISESYHPAWSKVYGDPTQPATSIVLGAKGSGKTAMRLQIVEHLKKWNREQPERRVFFIQYDDFNAYLGPLQNHFPYRSRSNPDKVLASINVWDHLDAILCQAVTVLVDQVVHVPSDRSEAASLEISTSQLKELDRAQQRDFLVLAACYDQSRLGSFNARIKKLLRSLHYRNLGTWLWLAVGGLGSLLSLGIAFGLYRVGIFSARPCLLIALLLVIASWFPYAVRYLGHFILARRVVRNVRVGRRSIRTLTRALMAIPSQELASQPLPTARGSDSRYAMLEKFQSLLRTLKFQGLIVLVDRVDEPELVNGRAERMRALVWPMLDNKLLKHPGLGIKLLLPSDLQYYLDRETREFHERARLDKQNFIANFDWTGEALFDLVVARMRACGSGTDLNPTQLFDESVSESRLIGAMQSLRTPRNLSRFLYRLIAEHCKNHRSTDPSYRIRSENFEATLAVFQNDLQRAAAAP